MINHPDIEVTVKTISPKGGQYVGLPPQPVTVKHLPTGISATCSYERSQFKNKMIAMSMVEYGLLELGISLR